jgi:DNA-binding LacI/PurR family transcriptional regulator
LAQRCKVTMQDVADHVGVSKMTVSAVLGGKNAHVRVSDATRKRVMEVAEQLHYRPNAVARSLRQQRTNIIGLYSGYGYLDARNPFLSAIIGGLQEGCDIHRKDLLLYGVFRGRSVEDIYSVLADGRIDGLILLAPTNDPLVDQLAESHLPVVGVVDTVPGLPSVVADDTAGMRLLVDYLIRQGHRRLLFRGGEPFPVSADRRRLALLETAEKYNLDVAEWYVQEQADPSDLSLAAWLDAPPEERPTAAICWNDLAAYNLIEHCRTHDLRVPEDLAVTGFDGIPTLPQSVRHLTTIRAPWPNVARTAVTLLVEQIGGKEVPQETTLPVEFLLGDTT